MKLLADESVDGALVDWLRTEGHDVSYVAEFSPAMSDEGVLRTAWEDGRAVLTADLDFGEMVFRQRLLSTGIVLLRYRAQLQRQRLALFSNHWHRIVPRIEGSFIVATNTRIRIRPLPLGQGPEAA